jgi:hypothetical protein
MATITLTEEKIGKHGGFVVLPLKEYIRLCKSAVPSYYLKGKMAEELDKLVAEGLKEYEKGETIEAPSLKEALKVYERRQKRQGKKH